MPMGSNGGRSCMRPQSQVVESQSGESNDAGIVVVHVVCRLGNFDLCRKVVRLIRFARALTSLEAPQVRL